MGGNAVKKVKKKRRERGYNGGGYGAWGVGRGFARLGNRARKKNEGETSAKSTLFSGVEGSKRGKEGV